MDHEEVEGLARAGERTASERLGGGGEGGGGGSRGSRRSSANVRVSGERAARRREGEARVAAVDHEEVGGRAQASERTARWITRK